MMQIAKECWHNVSAQSILSCWKKSRCLPDSFIVTINEEFAVYRKSIVDETVNNICDMFKSFNVEKCYLLHHQIKNDM